MKDLHYTVTMSANLAREIGIPAAMLYNQLVFMSQWKMTKDYDNQGWFYYTAKEFEEATTFSRNTMGTAIKVLVDHGYIENKRAYIKGTSVSANHFRIIRFWNPAAHEMCDLQRTSNVQPFNNKINKLNTVKDSQKSASQTLRTQPSESTTQPSGLNQDSAFDGPSISPRPSASDLHQAENEPSYLIDEKEEYSGSLAGPEPFAEPAKDGPQKLSLKPEDKNLATKRAAVVATRLYREFGLSKGKPDGKTVSLVKRRLAEGYTEDDLVWAVNWAKTDEFYQDKGIMSVLSNYALEKWQKNKTKIGNGGHNLAPTF